MDGLIVGGGEAALRLRLGRTPSLRSGTFGGLRRRKILRLYGAVGCRVALFFEDPEMGEAQDLEGGAFEEL
jgi:hypothetical protein